MSCRSLASIWIDTFRTVLPCLLKELWLGGRQVHEGYSERATMVIGKFPGQREEYDGKVDTKILSCMVMLYLYPGKRRVSLDYDTTILKCLSLDLFVHGHLPFMTHLEVLFQ